MEVGEFLLEEAVESMHSGKINDSVATKETRGPINWYVRNKCHTFGN